MNTTETASCFPSLTTTISGTSSPPSPCLDPSWYDKHERHTNGGLAALTAPPPPLGPPDPGWWPRHRPERQNLCLLDVWAKRRLGLVLLVLSTVSLFLPGGGQQDASASHQSPISNRTDPKVPTKSHIKENWCWSALSFCCHHHVSLWSLFTADGGERSRSESALLLYVPGLTRKTKHFEFTVSMLCECLCRFMWERGTFAVVCGLECTDAKATAWLVLQNMIVFITVLTALKCVCKVFLHNTVLNNYVRHSHAQLLKHFVHFCSIFLWTQRYSNKSSLKMELFG